MLERLRYVTQRQSRKGGVRWYWQRRGYPLTRLPDDRAERFAMVERLNAAADGQQAAELAPGSVAKVIAEYRESDEYCDLAPGTARYYNRYLRDMEALGPRLPFSSFTRRAVVELIESCAKPHQRAKCAAVLKNLFKIAHYRRLVATDETVGLRLRTSKTRDRIWSSGEIDRWLDAARVEDPHMVTGFLVLLFTAQRPNDVLRITWPQYSGSAIRLRQ